MKSPTHSTTCEYCGIPCANRFCSWECMRAHGSSETTWRRNAADKALAS